MVLGNSDKQKPGAWPGLVLWLLTGIRALATDYEGELEVEYS